MRSNISRTFTYFFALLAAVLLLAFLHIKGWLKPAESAAQQTTRPFVYLLSGTGNYTKSFFSFFYTVSSINRENASLRDQVRNLQEENAALQQYKVENDVLRSELNYRSTSTFDLVSADVIAKDATGFTQTIILDIGQGSGIEVGDAVISQGVLVGKISAVDQYTSKVLLITDPQSSIDAELSSSGQTGVLRGSFGSGVVLGDISQNIQVSKDDRVITAGQTGLVPKGILIGTIGMLQSQKNDLLQRASVVPAVDLKDLQFVAVIKK